MLLLSRKDQFEEKLEKEVAIFLIFALMFLGFKKAISYHPPAKRSIEVADILREHIKDYQEKYPLQPHQYKIVSDLLNCRTAYLGGHIEKCDQCGAERITYNSCRNRHCPKCQDMPRERWLEARKAELLPVSYFHTVLIPQYTGLSAKQIIRAPIPTRAAA